MIVILLLMTELQITFSIWLTPHELNTCVLIGCTLLQKEVLYGHYNKSFIDQACLVKMAGYWAEKKNKKQSNKLGHSPAIVTHPWSTVHIYCPTLCLELKSLTQNIKAFIF